MRKTVLILLGAAFHLAVALPVDAQTRPDDLSGATRAQFARVQDALDATAKQWQIARRTINAIAAGVFKDARGLNDAQLIDAIHKRAQTARGVVDENKRLQKRISNLEDPAQRDPALAALRRAETAINEGRFDDAERAYAAASKLLWSQTQDGQDAWQVAVNGQADAAILAGEHDRADEIFTAAVNEMDAAENRTERRKLELLEKNADQRYQEGLVSGRSAALERAAVIYRQRILPNLSEADTPVEWADTQNNLGNVLQTQGERTGGQQGQDQLAQAVEAYRAALRVQTEAKTPSDWADTQNNLGNVLQIQGERTGGQQGLELLAQAVAAYRAALRVQTEAEAPIDWARTQNNLGEVLRIQGERTGGQPGLDLLTQAVAANRAALRVFSEAKTPLDWVATQNNLGNVLLTQGERTGGQPRLDLLAQAVTAYRAALRVYTEAETPLDWADTQNNLGNALKTQGERTGGQQGLDLLAQAVTAYRAALHVRTEADTPLDWAATQNNLGTVLETQGERTSGQQGLDLLAQAVAAYRAALRVYTEAETPFDWAGAQELLGTALELQSMSVDGQQGLDLDLLTQAVAAFRAALRGYTAAGASAGTERVQRVLDRANALILSRQSASPAPPVSGAAP
ncbi:MAG: tetratricopeptide repeat protein [Burkholderiaceae bacterium]|nr:tetratricopeptide repeat protein [Burkholderiaceae bacterium]